MALNFSFLNSFFLLLLLALRARSLNGSLPSLSHFVCETGKPGEDTFSRSSPTRTTSAIKLRPTNGETSKDSSQPPEEKNILAFAPELENPETLYLEGKSFKKY